MVKKLYFVLFLFLGSLLFTGAAFSGEVVDRIVAVVNDDIIRLVELNRAVAQVEAQIRSKQYPGDIEKEEIYKIRTEILNNLIDEKLADQEIRNTGIFVDEHEIDNAIEQVKAMNYYSDEDLRAALAASNVSMEEYREEIKRQILRNKLVNARIKSKIIITESDIENYYNHHLDKYAPKEYYELQNIIMMYPPVKDKRSREAVYERMQAVYRELEAGASFDETARQYSEAMNAKDGGKLGSFVFNELAKNIQAAIKDLKPGEFSSITETDQGFQIFFVEKIENKGGRTFTEVTDEIRQLLYEETVNEKFQSWIDELRKDAHIKIIR